MYKCKYCSKEFETKQKLARHIQACELNPTNVKMECPKCHKLFYWTMFSPLIGIVVGYLSTVTILSIDPTSEPTAGLLTLFAVSLIPLTTLIILAVSTSPFS